MSQIHNKIKDKLFSCINYIILSTFTFICLYPFYYILIYSFSDPAEAIKGVYLWPVGVNLQNYIDIFKLQGILGSFLISSARAVIGTVVTVFCCALFAYVLTKNELYFRKLIYRFLVVTIYLNAGLIPWYLTMRMLGLKNNFLLYILPSAVVGFYVILIKTYIEQLPPALEESAMIDGAGYFTVFTKIIFPLSKPIIATIAVFSAVEQWNTWYDNFFLVSESNLQTLQIILYNYLNQAQNIANRSLQDLSRGEALTILTPESVKMTITMVVTLPIVFVYPFLQKYFTKGIMLGAIKG